VKLLATPPAGPVREWIRKEGRTLAVGCGVIVTTALGIGGYQQHLVTVSSKLEARIASSEDRIRRLETAASAIDRVQRKKAALVAQAGMTRRLEAVRYAPAQLLEVLSRSAPEGLWFVELKQAAGSVEVQGRALSVGAVTEFVGKLQGSGIFRDRIEIPTTSTETLHDTLVVTFAVRAVLISQPAAR
jgi:Tfp pilus assembly protein PilN